MELEGLLQRFWLDFGPNLKGNLEPSWLQNLKNEGAKTMSIKHIEKVNFLNHLGPHQSPSGVTRRDPLESGF